MRLYDITSDYTGINGDLINNVLHMIGVDTVSYWIIRCHLIIVLDYVYETMLDHTVLYWVIHNILNDTGSCGIMLDYAKLQWPVILYQTNLYRIVLDHAIILLMLCYLEIYGAMLDYAGRAGRRNITMDHQSVGY